MRTLLLLAAMAISAPSHAITASDMLDMCEDDKNPFYLACVYWFNGATTAAGMWEQDSHDLGQQILWCANTYEEDGQSKPATPLSLIQIWLRYVDKNPATLAKDTMAQSFYNMMREPFPCE